MKTYYKLQLIVRFLKAYRRFARIEKKRGTYEQNKKGFTKMEFPEDMSWSDLSEEKAKMHPERTFLIYEDKEISYGESDKNANKVGNFLLKIGGEKTKGLSIMMSNSPQFIDFFIGTQKIGMYTNLISTHLRGDSLAYIIDNSDTEFVVIDEDLLEFYEKIASKLKKVKKVIVNPSDSGKTDHLSKNYLLLSDAYRESSDKPDIQYNKEDICLIIYTSGTTGLPKGVVYRYKKTGMKMYSVVSSLLYKKSYTFYTCMPLFHVGALFTIFSMAMHHGAKLVLKKKFSASTFWDDIIKYKVNTFNSTGAMLTILMKQPKSPRDKKNKVRMTLSLACPADVWTKFEKRFGIKIFESYGATDGAGKISLNLATGPVGSIGKPPASSKYRIVDENMNDVPEGSTGELIFESAGVASVEYYKNPEATREKFKHGYIFMGDLVRRDEKGYLFFVGRKGDAMRIRGEMVSAFQVEHVILKHPAILEAAVYSVKSEMSEDDIMTSVLLVEGKEFKEEDLNTFLENDLSKYALPRYIKIVDEFEKTGSHRIIKKPLREKGIVKGTYDTVEKKYIE